MVGVPGRCTRVLRSICEGMSSTHINVMQACSMHHVMTVSLCVLACVPCSHTYTHTHTSSATTVPLASSLLRAHRYTFHTVALRTKQHTHTHTHAPWQHKHIGFHVLAAPAVLSCMHACTVSERHASMHARTFPRMLDKHRQSRCIRQKSLVCLQRWEVAGAHV